MRSPYCVPSSCYGGHYTCLTARCLCCVRAPVCPCAVAKDTGLLLQTAEALLAGIQACQPFLTSLDHKLDYLLERSRCRGTAYWHRPPCGLLPVLAPPLPPGRPLTP